MHTKKIAQTFSYMTPKTLRGLTDVNYTYLQTCWIFTPNTPPDLEDGIRRKDSSGGSYLRPTVSIS